ncbi:MAG: L,D-transpeptidase family protein [Nocardioides sp.]
MYIARRLALTLTLVVAIAAAGVGAGYALDLGGVRDATQRVVGFEPGPTPGMSQPPKVQPDLATKPARTTAPRRAPAATPEPTSTPEPEPQGGPPLMSPGDEGPDVRSLQARLRQIQWFNADVTGYYGEVTTTAVEGFQAKREIAVTGYVDEETMQRLVAMTSEPTADELANLVAASASNTPGALDARCTSGRVLCIDKTSNTLRWVVSGAVRTTVDVRFGGETTPTREGAFRVTFKNRDHVSSLYGSSMPFSMFFSDGQAVHYSSDFAAVGYSGASHGCVNVRDYDALAALYDQVQVGDTVIVYRS